MNSLEERQKILVVDDSKFNQELIMEILGEDYQYVVANDGLEAISILQKDWTIYMMLLDLNMPKMSGFEVLKYMRDNLFIDYIKVLMKNENSTYIGSSAGAIIAGTDIMLARDFDSNFVGMIDFTALELFDGTIIPHYEPENLQMYIQNTERHILNRYSKVLSVSNEDVVVIIDREVIA